MEWFENGNFSGQVIFTERFAPNSSAVIPIYAGINGSPFQIASLDSTTNFNVDALLIDLELYVLFAIILEVAITQHDDDHHNS